MGGLGLPDVYCQPQGQGTVGNVGPGAHLNWQKMSAYSAEMLEACRTVTRKVKMLPSFRWSRAASSGPSGAGFSGLSRRRSSGVTGGRGGSSARWGGHPPQRLPAALHQGSGLSTLGWAQEAGCWRRGAAPQPLVSTPSPAQVLLLTSSAEGPTSLTCPWPSTMRSSSWEVPERDIPTAGHDSDWNCVRSGAQGCWWSLRWSRLCCCHHPEHRGTSSSPLPPHGSPLRDMGKSRGCTGGCQRVGVCWVDWEHGPSSVMPAALGARWSPWGNITVAGRGLRSLGTHRELAAAIPSQSAGHRKISWPSLTAAHRSRSRGLPHPLEEGWG